MWIRRVWRYQRGNQNPYIEEEQTTQWPKERVQRNKQRSTKHTHKTKDGETRTPFKTGGELMSSGRVAVPVLLVTTAVLIWLQTVSAACGTGTVYPSVVSGLIPGFYVCSRLVLIVYVSLFWSLVCLFIMTSDLSMFSHLLSMFQHLWQHKRQNMLH